MSDFEQEIEGWVTDSEPALERYLDRATRDVDRMVGAWDYLTSGTYVGHKFDPDETDEDADGYLTAVQSTALVKATVAQAYYRIKLDEARSTSSSSSTVSLPLGAKRVRGPDFEVEYATGDTTAVGSGVDATYPFSTQAWAELDGVGLVKQVFAL